MDDAVLFAACRPGVAADEALSAAVRAGARRLFTGGPANAAHLGRVYLFRVRNMAEQGYLRSEEAAAVAELTALQDSDELLSLVVVRIGTGPTRRTHSALISGEPPTVRACFWHEAQQSRRAGGSAEVTTPRVGG